MNRKALVLSILALATACGSDPVDVEGEYSISVTNRENGCDFDEWTEGDTATGIPVTITQDEDQATASVEGGTGFFLDVVLGMHEFVGDVDGDSVELTLFGTRSTVMEACSYTINGVLQAELDGDVLTGRIVYQTNTNGSLDCGEKEDCESIQEFNGTRPPS